MANKIRPTIKIRYGTVNEPIRINTQVLFQDALRTYLTNDFTAGQSAITVRNLYGFTTNQILFIGNLGNDGSEFIKTHAATAPTGSTVTLASVTTQTHQNSDSVYILPFDKVEISYSLTLTGTKSVLILKDLSVKEETTYNDTAITSGYYWARFKNSIDNTYSDYSDGVPLGSYAMNTARYLIDSALAEINKTTSSVFSDEYGFQQINNCQMEVVRELKRWSWMQVFGATHDAILGNWKVALPEDIDDLNTNKGIFNLRLGNSGNMVWTDKEEFNNLTSSVSWTTLESTLSVGDATVTLVDSSDFDDSGSIQVGGVTINYTSNDKTNGILTLSAVSTVAFPVTQDVFQNASYGTPTYYTIHNGYLWHWPIVDAEHDGKDFNMDYYSKLTMVTKDTDEIVVPDPMLVKDYLVWKYLKRMNNGNDGEGAFARENFMRRLQKLKQTEVMNHKIILKPRFNDYSKLMTIDGDSKFVRTQGFYPNNF